MDLEIAGVHKFYGDNHVVRGLDLSIKEGEFTVLVGPSGCGKSTLLRMVAGLEMVDEGAIRLGGRNVTDVRPRDRDIAMVFQNYALYPYLTVFENIAFPLRARRQPHREIAEKTRNAADLLGLVSLLDRYPRQLSGGQRQRVAVGRAIVRDAGIFLFDEPLSNLDAKLRDEMRVELKRLHERLGKTFLYVTHDQIEAMTMADRIVLLHEGMVAQQGTPEILFDRPASRFVASFIGSPQVNIIPGRITFDGGACRVAFANGAALPVDAAQAQSLARMLPDGGPVDFGIRPDAISVASDAGDPNAVMAPVGLMQNMGPRSLVNFTLGDAELSAELTTRAAMALGREAAFHIRMEAAFYFDPASGRSLIHQPEDRP